MSTKKRGFSEVATGKPPVVAKVPKISKNTTTVNVDVENDDKVKQTDESAEVLLLPLSDVEKVRAKMAEFDLVVSKVRYGKRWKDEQTAEAVRRLEKLNFVHLIGLILAVKDVNEQWKLALEYTQTVATIVMTASERAMKRVNGAWGEFCPDAAEIIATGLWRQLCDKEERPDDELFDNIVQVIFLDKIFGDYTDLSFVSEG